MTKKCPTCGGDGIVVSEHTAAVDVERRLRGLVTPGSRSKAFKVEVAERVAWLLAGPGGSRLRELEETTKRRFFLVGKADEHLDHFRVLEQGPLDKVAPALPFAADAEVDVKLVEVGLHDSHAGVGKLDGVDVVVGDAAKLVGKKVKARITAVADGLAWAELLAPVAHAEPPLTAEAEAERPTRARKSTVKEPELDAEPDEAAGEVDEPDAEGEDPAATAKKKTRRGSRGGRNRKKKTAAASSNGAAPDGEGAPESVEAPESLEDVSEAAEEPPAGPVIHVPDPNLGADDDGETPSPAKKRTRRGSRGGRNRRKKTAAGTTTATVAEAEEPEQHEEPSGNGAGDGDGDWSYTPMSEWGLDEREG
jgi:predicted RNA-binding protein with TRAM domain